VGSGVGEGVGKRVGDGVGLRVGAEVGLDVGDGVGARVGGLGLRVGALVGAQVTPQQLWAQVRKKSLAALQHRPKGRTKRHTRSSSMSTTPRQAASDG
jgi:hypothetical protein